MFSKKKLKRKKKKSRFENYYCSEDRPARLWPVRSGRGPAAGSTGQCRPRFTIKEVTGHVSSFNLLLCSIPHPSVHVMQALLQIRNLQAKPLLATSPHQVLGRRRIDQFSRLSLVYFPFPMAPDTKPRGRIKCTYRHSSQYRSSYILKLTALYQNTLFLI